MTPAASADRPTGLGSAGGAGVRPAPAARSAPPVPAPAVPIDRGASPPGPGLGPPQPVRTAIGWSYLLSAGRIGSTVLVTFLLARLLGPAEFGLVAMATVFVFIAQTVVQHGLFAALVQHDGLTREHLDAAFGVLLIGGTAASLLTAATSPLWALLNRAPGLTAVCLALSPLVLVQALTIVPEALLRRELRFRAVAVRTLAAAVFSGAVGVVLALAGAGVWALVGQQLSNGLINLVVLWAVCPWRPRRRLRLGAMRDLWGFSAHATNAGIAWLIGSRADLICAGAFFGPVAAGIYRVATRLPDMLVDVAVRSIQQVALPSLARLQTDRAAFGAQLVRLQHLGAVAGLPALGVLAALAGPLVALLGPEWTGTEAPLRVLCLYGALNVYTVLLGPALQAIGQPGRLAVLTWLRALLTVPALVAVGTLVTGGDPPDQAVAVALTGVVLQLVVGVLYLWVTVHRAARTPVRRFLAPTLPAVVATVAAALVPLGVDRLGLAAGPPLVSLLITGGAGAGVAAAVLWAADRRLRGFVLARWSRVRRR